MLGNIYRLQQSLAVVLQGTLGGGGRGEGGCLARFFKSLAPFRPKLAMFYTRFQIWPLKDVAGVRTHCLL